MKSVVSILYFLCRSGDLIEERPIFGREISRLWNLGKTVILGKDEGPVNKVAIFTQQLCITAHLKVFPGKFSIVNFGSIGSEGVANLIGSKILEEIFKINGPPFRFTKGFSF